MKKKFKKAVVMAMAALCLSLSLSTAVSAYGIRGSNFYYTNSGGSHITSIGINSTVNASGSITYDASYWGWIPVPSKCCYYLETPAGSLNKPTSISGSWTSASFDYIGYSDVSGNAVYRMFKDFVLVYKSTKTVTAVTKSKSYSTSYYTGSVNTGTRNDSDGSSLCDIKTR